ncbi:MAG: PQQ-binding-like beta-propeller repeat protein [Spirochaetes bacterium]|nr:PQQ-binding-like beta-propeller repeat protein [Spirochaetota bacterium]
MFKTLKFILFFILILFSYSYSLDWPMFRGNHFLTGNNDQVIPKNLDLAWKFKASSWVFHPVSSDGLVYFPSLDKKLYCLDLETGELKWSYNLGYPAIRMPVIYGKWIYVASGRYIYCINKWNGNPVWSRSFGSYSQLSTPIVENGVLYYGNRGAFYARRADNGSLIWENENIKTYGGSPIFSDGKIFTQHRDYTELKYYLVCIEAKNGHIKWRRSIHKDPNIFTPVVYKSKVYIGTSYFLESYEIQTGRLSSSRRFSSRIGSNPIFIDDKIYISDTKGHIDILNPENFKTFKSFSNYRKKGNTFSSIGPWLYMTDTSGSLLEINKETGMKHRSFDSGSRLSARFPLLFRGRIIFNSKNTVFCLGKYPLRKKLRNKKEKLRLVFFNKDTRKRLTGRIRILWKWSNEWDDTIKNLKLGKIELKKKVRIPSIMVFEKKGFLTRTIKLQKIPQNRTLIIYLKPLKRGITLVFHDIKFNTDSSGLMRKAIAPLRKIVRLLKLNPMVKMSIQGHTDNTGTAKYNMTLSQKRAYVVYRFLVKHNISSSRLSYIGYGQTRPIADNKTKKGRSLNRRTEFKILQYQKEE